MSYKKFNASDVSADGNDFNEVEYFVADTVADISDLPGIDTVAFGSMCVCLENGKRYVLRQSGTWEVFGGE